MTFIKKYPEYLLLLLFSVIGFFSASAYGFAWDEYEQRNIGEVCYNYVFHNNLYYFNYIARDHGAIFEVLLLIIEKIAGITEFGDTYKLRHIVTHLFFLLSAFYFYKLIFLIYKKKTLAVLGFLLLVSLGISALLEAFGDYLKGKFPDVTIIFFYIVNQIITIAAT